MSEREKPRPECPCGGQIRERHVNLLDRTLMHWPGLRDLWREVYGLRDD